MTEVTLQSVVKRYGDVQVIHGVDLEVNAGEFCVFVGPSGCGKSTLLRMIAGLEETTEGKMHIGERDVTHMDAAKRGVAMVFQTYALYPHMTVRDNMAFGLKMSGVPKAEAEAKVAEAAKILKLDPFLDRKPKALSGGQRQRVAIGRAIVRAPDVFLFDEPLSNLDAELRVQMRLEIARLHKELSATMIYVTHDQVEAMTLADKIVVLRAGIVEQVGSPLDLYADPDNLFVAQFIGSPKTNILKGIVIGSEGDSLRVHLPQLADTELDVACGTHMEPGKDVCVGLRPQDFGPDGDVTIPVPVEVVESLGGVSYAYANLPGLEEPFCIEHRGRSRPEGSVIQARFTSATALLFDPESGKRIR